MKFLTGFERVKNFVRQRKGIKEQRCFQVAYQNKGRVSELKEMKEESIFRKWNMLSSEVVSK